LLADTVPNTSGSCAAAALLAACWYPVCCWTRQHASDWAWGAVEITRSGFCCSLQGLSLLPPQNHPILDAARQQVCPAQDRLTDPGIPVTVFIAIFQTQHEVLTKILIKMYLRENHRVGFWVAIQDRPSHFEQRPVFKLFLAFTFYL